MTYTMTRKTRMTFYLALVLLALWALLGCGETCISRNDAGVCLETTSDVIAAPGEVLDEIGESFAGDGTGVSPFDGGSGKGICKTTGLNCD